MLFIDSFIGKNNLSISQSQKAVFAGPMLAEEGVGIY